MFKVGDKVIAIRQPDEGHYKLPPGLKVFTIKNYRELGAGGRVTLMEENPLYKNSQAIYHASIFVLAGPRFNRNLPDWF